MGTQSPGTIQRTRFMLMSAMLRLLEKKRFMKITVNDICSEAMVSRSAFYVHFADKYELLFCCMEENFHRKQMEHSGLSPEKQMLGMLDDIQANRKLLHNLLQDNLSREILEMFERIIDMPIRERLSELSRAGVKLPGPPEFVASFYSGGIANIVLRWIREDFRTPREEIARCQSGILKLLSSTEIPTHKEVEQNV